MNKRKQILLFTATYLLIDFFFKTAISCRGKLLTQEDKKNIRLLVFPPLPIELLLQHMEGEKNKQKISIISANAAKG